MSAKPTNLFAHYVETGNLPAALNFAEWQLSRQPIDQGLLDLYSQTALESDPKRLDHFLRQNATNRSR
jgi:hypothetical protein